MTLPREWMELIYPPKDFDYEKAVLKIYEAHLGETQKLIGRISQLEHDIHDYKEGIACLTRELRRVQTIGLFPKEGDPLYGPMQISWPEGIDREAFCAKVKQQIDDFLKSGGDCWPPKDLK